jgi:hypothetical protein
VAPPGRAGAEDHGVAEGRPSSAQRVGSHGRWRYAVVEARQDWSDGRVFYRVSVDLRGDTSVTSRLYQWPQPGLRVSHGSHSAPFPT